MIDVEPQCSMLFAASVHVPPLFFVVSSSFLFYRLQAKDPFFGGGAAAVRWELGPRTRIDQRYESYGTQFYYSPNSWCH